MRLPIVLIAAVMIAFTWPFWLPALQAGEETFDADATETDITDLVGRYINASAPTTTDSTTTPVGIYNNRSYLIQVPLDDIDSGDAVLAAHIYITTQKSTTIDTKVGVHRVMDEWDPDAVSYVNKRAGVPWNKYSAKKWIFREGIGDADADTMASNASYDIMVPAFDRIPIETVEVTGAAAEIRLDITSMVRKWHSGAWENYGLILCNTLEDSTNATQTQLKSMADATPANRPHVVVVHGPINEAGSGSGSSASRIGRGERGVYN